MKIAIVTGASNGMGREFARVLDTQGLEEIWAVGLEEDNLKELQAELNTPVRIFAVDLTNGGLEEIIDRLQN